MKHLFQEWHSVQARVRQALQLAFFFDYDGTLTPIVSRPELALCPPEVRRLLGRLGDLDGVSVAIISGRTLEDVREKIGVPGIIYVGDHGLSIQNPAGVHKKKLPPQRQEEFDQIVRFLQERLGIIPGILLEDKKLNLALHYRNVATGHLPAIRQALNQAWEAWREHWEIRSGKRLWEIRPRAEFDKGKAVLNILQWLPASGLLPFCFGDDRTDEDAFRALQERGITVYVGPGAFPSVAEYYLRDSNEVTSFLKRIVRTWSSRERHEFSVLESR